MGKGIAIFFGVFLVLVGLLLFAKTRPANALTAAVTPPEIIQIRT